MRVSELAVVGVQGSEVSYSSREVGVFASELSSACQWGVSASAPVQIKSQEQTDK